MIPNEEAILTISQDGYIKRMNPNVYKVQNREAKALSEPPPEKEMSLKKLPAS